jgi:hypothetical protein
VKEFGHVLAGPRTLQLANAEQLGDLDLTVLCAWHRCRKRATHVCVLSDFPLTSMCQWHAHAWRRMR